mmetsp:Transcript_43797/g.81764  ORF Transcript_43797/g.81764 Transcript_43797/m.81764 type:complete len:277 (-) Transcript_43797:144-974(-)
MQSHTGAAKPGPAPGSAGHVQHLLLGIAGPGSTHEVANQHASQQPTSGCKRNLRARACPARIGIGTRVAVRSAAWQSAPEVACGRRLVCIAITTRGRIGRIGVNPVVVSSCSPALAHRLGVAAAPRRGANGAAGLGCWHGSWSRRGPPSRCCVRAPTAPSSRRRVAGAATAVAPTTSAELTWRRRGDIKQIVRLRGFAQATGRLRQRHASLLVSDHLARRVGHLKCQGHRLVRRAEDSENVRGAGGCRLRHVDNGVACRAWTNHRVHIHEVPGPRK